MRRLSVRGGKCLQSNLFFFSSRRRHTRLQGDWSSDVCSSDLIIATELGKAIRFSEAEVRAMGRDTQGVIGIKLSKGDAVAGMATVIEGGDLLVVTQRGYGKRTPLSEYPMHHRAGQGVFTLKVTDRVGKLAAGRVGGDAEGERLVS